MDDICNYIAKRAVNASVQYVHWQEHVKDRTRPKSLRELADRFSASYEAEIIRAANHIIEIRSRCHV